MEFERQQFEPVKVRNGSVYPLILVSLGLHLIIGLLVLTQYTSQQRIKKSDTVNEVQAIQAELVFVQTPPITDPIPSPLQQPEVQQQLPEETLEVAEAPMDKRATLPTIDFPVQTTNPENVTPVTNTQPLSSKQMAQQHLKSFSNQADLQLAQQAAQDYQESKSSPILPVVNVDHYITEDEKYLQQLAVKVDCSSGLNKTIAFISGIAGGGLNCSKAPQIDSFIERRLNKIPASDKQ